MTRAPLCRGRRIAQDIARAIGYMHSKGAIHQDLKSRNVLLSKDWQAKVGAPALAGAVCNFCGTKHAATPVASLAACSMACYEARLHHNAADLCAACSRLFAGFGRYSNQCHSESYDTSWHVLACCLVQCEQGSPHFPMTVSWLDTRRSAILGFVTCPKSGTAAQMDQAHWNMLLLRCACNNTLCTVGYGRLLMQHSTFSLESSRNFAERCYCLSCLAYLYCLLNCVIAPWAPDQVSFSTNCISASMYTCALQLHIGRSAFALSTVCQQG